MSQQLAACLVAVAVNLVGMMAIYAVMTQAVARLAWRGRGIFGVFALIVVAQLFWIVPALLIVIPRDPDGASSYALWFGNWLVSGFSLALFSQSAMRIPIALHDSARLDGLGGFGTWRHAVFPFVRRDLVLIAIFTVIATLLPFWGLINQPDTANVIVLFQRFSSPAERTGLMIACSLAGALLLIAIFLVAKRRRLPRRAGSF
jgi:ABC-type glycerol-3-phosphate transport system permease component